LKDVNSGANSKATASASTSQTLTGLKPGVVYSIVACTVNANPAGQDVCMTQPVSMNTMSPGTVVAVSSYSATVAWTISDTTNISQFSAFAQTASGSSANGTASVVKAPFPSPIPVTITGLAPANTSYIF